MVNNKITFGHKSTLNPHYGNVRPGQIFQFYNDEALYMKTSKPFVCVNLETGELLFNKPRNFPCKAPDGTNCDVTLILEHLEISPGYFYKS